jgi:hypothetical protein
VDGIEWLARPILGILARPASYLDPGSGSYLLQLLIAGALGAAFAVRLYWKRIKGFFSGFFNKSTDEDEGDRDA